MRNDEFQDAASRDGDWLIIGKFTESVEWSNRNYSAVYDCRMMVLFDQHAELDFYSASSLKQQSAGWHVAPLGHIILILSQPVFSLTP
jgi:hypothetical protein